MLVVFLAGFELVLLVFVRVAVDEAQEIPQVGHIVRRDDEMDFVNDAAVAPQVPLTLSVRRAPVEGGAGRTSRYELRIETDSRRP